jgi:hypothetical protein
MAEFDSWKQYSEFSDFVRRKARFVLDDKNQRFLKTVVETSAKRKCTIGRGDVLWRAQLDHALCTQKILDENQHVMDSFDVEVPSPPERMMPWRDRAVEGRINPKGIPCLYCSTDRETAMGEMRPWIGSYLSVAEFVVLKDLTVVDCSTAEKLEPWRLDLCLGLNEHEPEPDKREKCVWGDINRAFYEPVARTDDVAEYVPTQVLAEAFRSVYDGIVYGSKLGRGKNVAIFDLAAAEPANRHLHRVEGVTWNFSVDLANRQQ